MFIVRDNNNMYFLHVSSNIIYMYVGHPTSSPMIICATVSTPSGLDQ